MAINDATANTLSSWFTDATKTATKPVTAAATPSPVGSAFAGVPAPQQSTQPKANAAAPAIGGSNVAQWYTDVTGRKGDKGGMEYWNTRLSSGEDSSKVYSDFVLAARNNEDYNPKTSPALLDLDSLKNRDVTPGQTVSGQLQGLLDANSNYIQSARDRAQRASNARGLSNSSIAASAGEDSAYQAALPIATSDAQVNRDVNAYNAALYNQGLMYNTDAQNAVINKGIDYTNQSNLQSQQASSAAAQQQAQIAADKASQAAALSGQMGIAQLQAETSKYQADKTSATSQYNTDANVRNQAEQNKTTLVNNIIQSAELSPDRKAELLKQLGETGLASAIYVASDIAKDLQMPPSINPGGDGGG